MLRATDSVMERHQEVMAKPSKNMLPIPSYPIAQARQVGEAHD